MFIKSSIVSHVYAIINIVSCLFFHFSSSSAFLRSLLRQSSHLSAGLPRFLFLCLRDLFGYLLSFILTMCPAYFTRVLIILPTMQQALVPTSSLRSFILLLSTLFTSTILLIQLFSCTCCLHCCCSDIATVCKPYLLAGTTLECRIFPAQLNGNLSIHHYSLYFSPNSLMEIFLSIVTPSTFPRTS